MAKAKSVATLPLTQLPECAQCAKPVERLTVTPITAHPEKVIVEFECHGEHASQEMSAKLLLGRRGLSTYTAFNEYTSGLMPKTPARRARAKKGGAA